MQDEEVNYPPTYLPIWGKRGRELTSVLCVCNVGAAVAAEPVRAAEAAGGVGGGGLFGGVLPHTGRAVSGCCQVCDVQSSVWLGVG